MNDPFCDSSSDLHLFEGFGVELEYMIVDRQSYKVRPIADHILRTKDGRVANELERGALAWSNELVLHALELKTNGPVLSLIGLDPLFHQDILQINKLLQPIGARLMPSGVHPFMDPDRETRLWPYDSAAIYQAFDRIFNCRGHGWANLQSIHLNLPFCGNDEFARLHSAIRLVLPLIPALSAASPYLDGRDTGLLDGRLDMYSRNCAKIFSITAHVVPEAVSSIQEYQHNILQPIYHDLAPYDPEGVLQYEWTNARGAIARFERQTIEIRIIDVQECPLADIAVLTAVCKSIERLTYNPEALALGDRLTADRLWCVLQDTIEAGEHAVVKDSDYLRCLGFSAQDLRAGDIWYGMVEAMDELTIPHRHTLNVIMKQGTLASRMKQLTGECTPEHLNETCGALCDCLEGNHLLIP